jgi:hypothetical protein
VCVGGGGTGSSRGKGNHNTDTLYGSPPPIRDRVSLCSSGCPGTHSVDQAGLELRNPPASASQVLGLRTNIFNNMEKK